MKREVQLHLVGFFFCKEGLRKIDKHNYKIINPIPETRTNCQASLGPKNVGENFIVHDFVEEQRNNSYVVISTNFKS